jgi:hypothetical protein
MVAVRMMQVAVDQIVDMIGMRHRLMATVGAVLVALGMAAAIVIRRAAVRIGRAHRDDVLVEMILVRMMKMAVVQIVHVPLMAHRGMAATNAVLVRMVVMDVVRGHFCHFSLQWGSSAWATAFSTSVST